MLLHCEQITKSPDPQIDTPKNTQGHVNTDAVKKSDIPVVFLHGFLGDSSEWDFLKHDEVNDFLSKFTCYAIDLPGHGKSHSISIKQNSLSDTFISSTQLPYSEIEDIEDFKEIKELLSSESNGFHVTSQLISQTLSHHGVHRYHLVGYSLGARIALFHTLLNELNKESRVQALILESANFGLNNALDKAARLNNDENWANIFQTNNATSALTLWYNQSVFTSLTPHQRKSLIEKRKQLSANNIAEMLLYTSLAKQPDLLPFIKKSKINCSYFVGEKDEKFLTLATHYHQSHKYLDLESFHDAGHNIHFEQPVDFTLKLEQKLNSCSSCNSSIENTI